MLHSIKRDKIKTLAINFDINKAYDKVNWELLAKIMEKLGFIDKWIKNINTMCGNH